MKKLSHAQKIAVITLVILISAAGVYLATALTRARHSLTEAAAEVDRQSEFPFRLIPLDRPLPSGFEPVSSSSQFTGAALFNGRFYVCGPSGLLAFDLQGALAAQYRPGFELPPAPLVRMTVAATSALGPQLWIATAGEGLLQFDGTSFRQMRPEDSGTRAFTAVLPLSTGRVLLGSEKSGVLAWDGKTLTQLHPALGREHITALAGTESDLWAGTIDRGLLHWHAGQLDRFTEGSGLPDPRVLSLALGARTVFAGTPLGVAEFQDGRFTRTLASGFFANALLANDETLSVGTLEEGVIDVPLTAQRSRPRSSDSAATLGAVEQFIRLESRTYALTRSGLFERAPKSPAWNAVLEIPGARLSDGNISALNADRSGLIWVGYFDRGLDILDAAFTHTSHFEDEHLFCVNRIATDPANSVTSVATANGLVLFDAGQKPRRVLTKADGLIASHVTDVIMRPGSMTIATPAGLTTIGPSGTTSLYAFHGLVNNHVYTLAASGSRLLAGTLGGLSMLDSGVVTASYTTANSGLKHNWVTSIVGVGNDWFLGTYGAGVLKLDASGRWTSFPDLKGGLVINPNAMIVSDTAVYAGTLGKGLAVFNRQTERWTFLTRGLPSLNVTALTTSSTHLYIGTDNGLVRSRLSTY